MGPGWRGGTHVPVTLPARAFSPPGRRGVWPLRRRVLVVVYAYDGSVGHGHRSVWSSTVLTPATRLVVRTSVARDRVWEVAEQDDMAALEALDRDLVVVDVRVRGERLCAALFGA